MAKIYYKFLIFNLMGSIYCGSDMPQTMKFPNHCDENVEQYRRILIRGEAIYYFAIPNNLLPIIEVHASLIQPQNVKLDESINLGLIELIIKQSKHDLLFIVQNKKNLDIPSSDWLLTNNEMLMDSLRKYMGFLAKNYIKINIYYLYKILEILEKVEIEVLEKHAQSVREVSNFIENTKKSKQIMIDTISIIPHLQSKRLCCCNNQFFEIEQLDGKVRIVDAVSIHEKQFTILHDRFIELIVMQYSLDLLFIIHHSDLANGLRWLSINNNVSMDWCRQYLEFLSENHININTYIYCKILESLQKVGISKLEESLKLLQTNELTMPSQQIAKQQLQSSLKDFINYIKISKKRIFDRIKITLCLQSQRFHYYNEEFVEIGIVESEAKLKVIEINMAVFEQILEQLTNDFTTIKSGNLEGSALVNKIIKEDIEVSDFILRHLAEKSSEDAFDYSRYRELIVQFIAQTVLNIPGGVIVYDHGNGRKEVAINPILTNMRFFCEQMEFGINSKEQVSTSETKILQLGQSMRTLAVGITNFMHHYKHPKNPIQTGSLTE